MCVCGLIIELFIVLLHCSTGTTVAPSLSFFPCLMMTLVSEICSDLHFDCISWPTDKNVVLERDRERESQTVWNIMIITGISINFPATTTTITERNKSKVRIQCAVLCIFKYSWRQRTTWITEGNINCREQLYYSYSLQGIWLLCCTLQYKSSLSRVIIIRVGGIWYHRVHHDMCVLNLQATNIEKITAVKAIIH